MELKEILKKVLRDIKKEKKWVVLEGRFLEKLKRFVSQRNEEQTRAYANACSRAMRREHRFEKRVFRFIEMLEESNPSLKENLNKLKEQIRVYENNIISKISKPLFGERGTVPELLKQEEIDWARLEIEVHSAYTSGVQQLVTLLANMEKEFTMHLELEARYSFIKPGKGIKGDYIKLSELIKRRSLISNKVNVDIRGNEIYRDSRPVQGCRLIGGNIEFIGYHFTNEESAKIIEKRMKFEIKNFMDPYVYLLEPMDYSGKSENEMRYLTGSSAATDVVIAKIIYPAERVWLKFEKDRPTHFAVEGDISIHHLIKRKKEYIVHKKVKSYSVGRFVSNVK